MSAKPRVLIPQEKGDLVIHASTDMLFTCSQNQAEGKCLCSADQEDDLMGSKCSKCLQVQPAVRRIGGVEA